MVEAPGYHALVRGYYDGRRFYVDASQLYEALGFRVIREGHVLVAMDARRRYRLDFAAGADSTEMLVDEGRALISMERLAGLFESDIAFDERRLSLRLSTAAEGFDSSALIRRSALLGQAPGPLRFGRERRILSGVVASYHVSWHQQAYRPGFTQASVRFTADALGGALQGAFGSTPRMSYLLDLPPSRFVTHMEMGRLQGRRSGGPLDALRISNLPLGSRHLQRSTTLSGRTEPHARVEAIVSGLVVDRAEADSEGRYRLEVPTYYGSTEAEIRQQPLGAGHERRRRYFLLTTDELAEPGRLYYDAWLGPAAKGLHASFGLLPRLTLRASGEEDGGDRRVRIGGVASPLRPVVVAVDVEVTSGAFRATARWWRDSFSANASYDYSLEPRRKLFHAQASGYYRGLSGFVTATATGYPGLWHARSLGPSVTFQSRRGLTAKLELAAEQYGQSARALQGVHSWRTSVGRVGSMGRASGRIALFARGMPRSREAGLDGYVTARRISLGLAASYDFRQRSVVASATLRLDTRAVGLISRASYAGRTLYHDQTLYGSVALGRTPRLSGQALAQSSALLRIFEDENGNGRLDGAERILPHVEAQLYHAGLVRTQEGTLRAAFLEPFTAYQVQILEASIRDPLLRPATGYTFSFVADPGRTKILDIPLVRLPQVTGTVGVMDRAPARLQVRVLQSGELVETAEVYRDGAFALRLAAGSYTLQLRDLVSKEVVEEASFVVPLGTARMEIHLNTPEKP